eukprot:TRINITY_DN97132_c0_g1_i1.p1 TRINITY_DN97132_c0_g1~~TRINITY_DN97132_c0_g1_i1.p1  ORF type:complete len:217 (-),score=23.98 TRINITY_DN97132_c0_g1_i1:55-642(-)
MLRCRDSTFSAYYCVHLFDSIGFELFAQDLQEAKGPVGQGVYCTLDLEKAQSTGKTVLLVEFKPNGIDHWNSGFSELLLSTSGNGDNWRERGYAGVMYGEADICIRVEAVRVLYRREWRHSETAWPSLHRILHCMEDPPLALDSDASQTDAAWAKSLERLKGYGDKQTKKTAERLGPVWLNNASAEEARVRCCVS